MMLRDGRVLIPRLVPRSWTVVIYVIAQLTSKSSPRRRRLLEIAGQAKKPDFRRLVGDFVTPRVHGALKGSVSSVK